MAKVKETRKFEAEDGTEFDTQEEAERYEKLKVARDGFERASDKLTRALAESFKTGDGEPFRMGANYYCVFEHYANEGITWESFYLGNTKVEDDHRPALIRTEQKPPRYEPVTTSFYFDMMFGRKKDALKKVLEIRRQRLGWLQESIADVEKEIEKER